MQRDKRELVKRKRRSEESTEALSKDMRKHTVSYLAQPKIGQFDVASVREEDVIGLEIPVDDVPLVEVLEGKRDLGDVEAGHLLVEEPVDGEQGLEVPADEVLHDEENVVRGLEAIEEADDEGGFSDGEGIPLSHDLAGHVLLHHLFLAHHLQGKHTGSCSVYQADAVARTKHANILVLLVLAPRTEYMHYR